MHDISDSIVRGKARLPFVGLLERGGDTYARVVLVVKRFKSTTAIISLQVS